VRYDIDWPGYNERVRDIHVAVCERTKPRQSIDIAEATGAVVIQANNFMAVQK
jgi:hypothetical protein